MYLKHERRLTEALVLYWQSLRGERPYPLLNEIKETEIPELWSDCFLLRVEEQEQKALRFDAVGDHIRELAGSPDKDHQELGGRIMKLAVNVLQSGRATTDEQEFPINEERVLKYRAIMLPLGSEGHVGVTHLIGGVRFKRFPVMEDNRNVEPDPYEGLLEEKPKRTMQRDAFLPQGGVGLSPEISDFLKRRHGDLKLEVQKDREKADATSDPLFLSPAEYQALLEKEQNKPESPS